MPPSPTPTSPRAPRFIGASPSASLVRVLTRRARRTMTLIKRIVYRLPMLRNAMLPAYRYWVDPGELSAMVGLIDATRGTGGAVVEIGVARGETSVFLLEHLRTTGDRRTLVLVDTFNGFHPGRASTTRWRIDRSAPPRSPTTPTVAPESSNTALLVSDTRTTASSRATARR